MVKLSCVSTKKTHFKAKKSGKCLKCSKKAIITLPYGPQSFCKEHFMYLTEKRVKKTIRQHNLIKRKERLLVAVSGGKDSTLALYLINKIFRKSNEIYALMIDEGIPGYRNKALAIAIKNAQNWNVPFSVVSFKEEFGLSMHEIAEKFLKKNPSLGTACSFCGVLRRRIMNSFARKINANKLITGHNLDDETQSILMNIFDNNFNKFIRLGPKSGIKEMPDFVPRIKPLIEIPEKEIVAYLYLHNIKFYDLECCPYSSEAKRNHFRSMLNSFEESFPGTKHSILRFYLKLKSCIKNNVTEKANYCKYCNEITSSDICNVCRKLNSLKK